MSVADRLEQTKQDILRSAVADYIEKKRKRVDRLKRKTNGDVTFSGDNSQREQALIIEQHQLDVARLVWADLT